MFWLSHKGGGEWRTEPERRKLPLWTAQTDHGQFSPFPDERRSAGPTGTLSSVPRGDQDDPTPSGKRVDSVSRGVIPWFWSGFRLPVPPTPTPAVPTGRRPASPTWPRRAPCLLSRQGRRVAAVVAYACIGHDPRRRDSSTTSQCTGDIQSRRKRPPRAKFFRLTVTVALMADIAHRLSVHRRLRAVGPRRYGLPRRTAFPQHLDLTSIVMGRVVIAQWHATPVFFSMTESTATNWTSVNIWIRGNLAPKPKPYTLEAFMRTTGRHYRTGAGRDSDAGSFRLRSGHPLDPYWTHHRHIAAHLSSQAARCSGEPGLPGRPVAERGYCPFG